MFDIHWLYRYAIVKFDVTERNDVTKRHGIDIAIWRTSAIEVTAFMQKEMKGMQEKESTMGMRDRQKNPSLSITV